MKMYFVTRKYPIHGDCLYSYFSYPCAVFMPLLRMWPWNSYVDLLGWCETNDFPKISQNSHGRKVCILKSLYWKTHSLWRHRLVKPDEPLHFGIITSITNYYWEFFWLKFKNFQFLIEMLSTWANPHHLKFQFITCYVFSNVFWDFSWITITNFKLFIVRLPHNPFSPTRIQTDF